MNAMVELLSKFYDNDDNLLKQTAILKSLFQYCDSKSSIIDDDISKVNKIVEVVRKYYFILEDRLTKKCIKLLELHQIEALSQQVIIIYGLLTKKRMLGPNCKCKLIEIDNSSVALIFVCLSSLLLSRFIKMQPQSTILKGIVASYNHVLTNFEKEHITLSVLVKKEKAEMLREIALKVRTLIKALSRMVSEFFHTLMESVAKFTGIESLIQRSQLYAIRLSINKKKGKSKGNYLNKLLLKNKLTKAQNNNYNGIEMLIEFEESKGKKLILDDYCLNILNAFGEGDNHLAYFSSADNAKKYLEDLFQKLDLVVYSSDFRQVINSCTALNILRNYRNSIDNEEVYKNRLQPTIKQFKGKEEIIISKFIEYSLNGIIIDEQSFYSYYEIVTEKIVRQERPIEAIMSSIKCFEDNGKYIIKGYLPPRETYLYYLLEICNNEEEMIRFLSNYSKQLKESLDVYYMKNTISSYEMETYYINLRGVRLICRCLLSLLRVIEPQLNNAIELSINGIEICAQKHQQFISSYIAIERGLKIYENYSIYKSPDIINDTFPLELINTFCDSRKDIINEHMSNLANKIIDSYTNMMPTEEFIKKINEIYMRIDEALRNQINDTEFKLSFFGSLVNGTATNKSDIDLAIIFPNEYGGYPKHAFEKVKNALKKSSNIENIVIKTLSKRLLLLNFKDQISKMECDLNVNSVLGIVNATFFNYLTQCDERFHILAIWLKEWAKSKKIQGAHDGFPTSYAYICMLAVLFMDFTMFDSTIPPVLPNLFLNHIAEEITFLNYKFAQKGSPEVKLNNAEPIKYVTDIGFNKDIKDAYKTTMKAINKLSVGTLASLFFKFYGYIFNPKTTTISVKLGKFSPRDPSDNVYFFRIEDPFDHKHNPGQTIKEDCWGKIQRECKVAYTKMIQGNDPIS